MRYIIFAIMLMLSTQVQAGGELKTGINQQLRESPEMDARCGQNINFYQEKITRYELSVHLSAGKKIVLHYYKTELQAWQDYCYGDSLEDPDFR